MHSFDEPPRRLSRLRVPFLVASAVAAIVIWLVFYPLSIFESSPTEVGTQRDTGEVRVASLTESFSASGTLTAEQEWTILHPGAGTITEIAEPSSAVETGSVLYRVDNVPTVAVLGTVPAYRTMTVDSVGADVEQLEQALVDLGYDSSNLLSVDGTYTSYTASLVELWQTDLGTTVTGTIDYGTVAFVPGGLHVGEVLASTGDPANGTELLALESNDLVVLFDVEVGDLESVANGSVLEVRLPDSSEFAAEVRNRSNAGDGLWMIEASPIDAPSVSARSTPVDLNWTVDLATDATVVSAGAIRRLDNGETVVEVVGTSDLDTQFVVVEVGLQSGSSVELLSGPDVGTVVIEP